MRVGNGIEIEWTTSQKGGGDSANFGDRVGRIFLWDGRRIVTAILPIFMPQIGDGAAVPGSFALVTAVGAFWSALSRMIGFFYAALTSLLGARFFFFV